jgi:hypothetical protein
MGFPEIVHAFAAFMDRDRRDWALIGAFALYAYGYVRATRDIDFVVRREDQAVVTRFLESLGFETVHSSQAFSNHEHPVGRARVDVMYVDGNTAEQIFAAAAQRVVQRGRPVNVVSPQHLVAMKLFAAANNAERRLKDLADVAELARRTTLDRKQLRATLEKYHLEDYYGAITGESAED